MQIKICRFFNPIHVLQVYAVIDFTLYSIVQNTAPPIINTLSSSLLTQLTTLFAAPAKAALLAFAGATAYSSNTGVLHARQVCVVAV